MTGMKASTIKSVLRSKIDNLAKSFTLDPTATKYKQTPEGLNEWVPKYTPEQLLQNQQFVQMFKDNVIVSGGAIASMLQGESPNDYDIYLKTKAATLQIANFYVNKFNAQRKGKGPFEGVSVVPFVKELKFTNIKGEEEDRVCIYVKSAGAVGEESNNYQYFESTAEYSAEEYIEGMLGNPVDEAQDILANVKYGKQYERYDYRPVFLSDNAITLNHKVQIIIRFYGDAEQIHKNFDFAHAMCWYDYKSDKLELPQESLEALLSKNLVYKGSLYPIASLFRIRKFLDRGFRITAGQMLKMIWQVNELNLKDHKILKDQLLGVDVAYMHELLRAIESEEKLGRKIDATYLAKLVDKVFE